MRHVRLRFSGRAARRRMKSGHPALRDRRRIVGRCGYSQFIVRSCSMSRGSGGHQIVRRPASQKRRRSGSGASRRIGYVLDDGTTLLMAATENPDVEVRVLDLILDAFPSLTPINERRLPRSARRGARRCAALCRALCAWTSTRTFERARYILRRFRGTLNLSRDCFAPVRILRYNQA